MVPTMTREPVRPGLSDGPLCAWMSGVHGWRVVVFVILVISCGGDGAAVSTAGRTSETSSQDFVAQGAQLYAASCAECHGADLRGTDRGPSHLSIVYEPNHHSDAVFALAVNNGVRAHHWNFGPMLPVEGLSQSDVEAIVAFVRSEQRREGFEQNP